MKIAFPRKLNSYQHYLILSLLICSQYLVGCVSTKELAYFQDDAAQANASAATAERYVPKIQVGDILSVQVSSLNPEASSFFNPYTATAIGERTGQPLQVTTSTPLPAVNGYLVDPTGAIELPMVGKVNVAGQTVAQIKEKIRGMLTEYLKEPTVNVRNLTFRVSVMGEVSRPSLFAIPNEQITLLEALSLSGDVTIYGRRDNILIIREENGQRTFGRIDLTKRDIFNSPYYYLHPNDVVYVEPGRARAATADRTNQLLPIVLSALSFVAIIVSRF
ncbi:polysaccharide biosynthesis/export family protein [Spirosoma sordidisoli]|uniref:Polysaccharide export protein n=1 Tax=Spirosoma sordidisoli TaxID=2502893 RepID=A0A4Q2UWU8_9BACT|nr:polysaccharide biosynthesis/export family protein [Spirosoma sordidisoli]RYC71469.1 polysaccharide export protein [Spirosoma sordidisoli]